MSKIETKLYSNVIQKETDEMIKAEEIILEEPVEVIETTMSEIEMPDDKEEVEAILENRDAQQEGIFL